MADRTTANRQKHRLSKKKIMHAYSMKDCAREKYIFFVAIGTIAIIPIVNQIAGSVGVAISLGTGTAFGALYWVFDRYVWRLPGASRFVGIPHVAGTWRIAGQSKAADGTNRDWTATVRIEQTWSKIAISVETEHSRSRSTMAAFERDPGHGYRLIYGYANEPKTAGSELKSHRGTCEVIFAADLQQGQGTYFNDNQRRTVGEMQWKRTTENGG